jgi:hypothetical protein
MCGEHAIGQQVTRREPSGLHAKAQAFADPLRGLCALSLGDHAFHGCEQVAVAIELDVGALA